MYYVNGIRERLWQRAQWNLVQELVNIGRTKSEEAPFFSAAVTERSVWAGWVLVLGFEKSDL
jgi:hypothetical protein